MKRSLTIVVGLAAGLLAFLGSSRDAHALGPVDLELGAKAGVGTNPSSGDANPLGFGLGARGGVSIIGLYGGVNFMYYTGGSQDLPAGAGKISYHATQLGLEAGFGIKLVEVLTIRPQVGFGSLTFSSSTEGGGQTVDASTGYFYLEPGVVGMVSLGTLFVGADANLMLIPGVDTGPSTSETQTAVTLHGQVGVKF